MMMNDDDDDEDDDDDDDDDDGSLVPSVLFFVGVYVLKAQACHRRGLNPDLLPWIHPLGKIGNLPRTSPWPRDLALARTQDAFTRTRSRNVSS